MDQKLWRDLASLAFRLTALSFETGAGGFISMTEPSTLAEKAIGRPNATWNSVSNEPLPALESLILVHMLNCDYT